MDETQMQHADSVQQMFASLAAMMREQQQFMAQTAELQRQMAATLQQQQQQSATQQQQSPSPEPSSPDTRKYRAEGITMPKFAGTKDDDVADYLFSAKLYFESKNIKYSADAPQQRPLSLLVANLKGLAAAWYREHVCHDGNFLHSVTQFEELLTSEFTTPDRQEHLRDQLLRLRQKNFTCLEDYVSAFRHIICKVEDMSDIDKVMHFQKGLVVEIRQEVKLRQFRNTTDAISFALMYERTHAVSTNQDVILGLPWLVQFNPRIDWQTGVMRFHKQRVVSDLRSANSRLEVSEPTVASVKVKPESLQHPLPQNLRQQLDDYVKAGYFNMPLGPSSMPALEVNHCHESLTKIVTMTRMRRCVKTSPKVKAVPLQLQAVLEEFADVFPAELPPGLPPNRSIEHELVLKSGATPSNLCEVLRANKLYARPDKCDFGQSSVDFLGHTIGADGLHVDALKSRAIAEWTEPGTTKDLQRFLGLAGYYRRFIHNFATLVLPLSSLVKKDVAWVWGEHQRQAFNAIKLALQHAPVLRLPDFDKPFIVTTDASHACIGGVLSQLHDGNDVPVAFFSEKLGPHELNWPVHEKELFAIKQALTRWRHYLHGVSFDIYTDNSACKWFLQHPRLSGRLARWLDFFASFQFKLHHRPGALNVVADALSRPPEVFSSLGEVLEDGEAQAATMAVCTTCLASPTCMSIRHAVSRRTKTTEKLQSIPIRDQVVMLAVKQPAAKALGVGTAQWRMRLNAASIQDSTVISSLQLDIQTKKAFQKAYGKDPVFKPLWKAGRPSEDYEIIRGLTYLKSDDSLRRLCVPNNQKLRFDVIHNAHAAAIKAHPGIRRTQLAAAQWYSWPSMDLDIKDYVQSCESCMRYNSSTGRKTGNLQPIPLPAACWEVVSTDFITHLPVSDGFDAIMVVVDKLSKRPVSIPTHTTATAEDIAKLFFNNVIRYYGIPSTIISDRDPKFTSKFWKALVGLMKIKTAMTTAHRAQADGQTERLNRTLEDSLRCSISYNGNDWNENLPMIDAEGDQPVARSRVEYASRFVQHRQKVIEHAPKNLLDAQEAQKRFYDKRRAANPFEVGDLALLSTQDLIISHATAETTLRSRKFIPRFIGPYPILELKGNVALLDLPANLKHLSPRFNIDKLKVYNSNPDRFAGRVIPKATPVIFDDNGEPLHVGEALIVVLHTGKTS
ncbi:unnamed protein product [Phytophthora lilii]|uniref:RNA-directed DNA polymerase n=1 Tax=Phytophthora lilii TaxID=2077276 RepID=A0A9W6TX48_9STRA|nr:unnamed protein product [Phytophthora lilii]